MNISSKQFDFPIKTPEFYRYDGVSSQKCNVPMIGAVWSMRIQPGESSINVAHFQIKIKPEMLPIAERFKFRVSANIHNTSYDSGWIQFLEDPTVLTTEFQHCQYGYRMNANATLSIKPKISFISYDHTEEVARELVADNVKLLGDEKYSDFTFLVGEKKFKGHKVILAFASDVFDKLFTSELEESRKNVCKVDKIQPEIFQHMLRYIYGGGVPEDLKDIAAELFEAAHYYEIKSLTEICSLEIQSTVSKENAVSVYEWASLYDQENLKMKAWGIIKSDILKENFELQEAPVPIDAVKRLVENKEFSLSFKK